MHKGDEMRYVGLGALVVALLLGSIGSPAAGAAPADGSWYRVQFARTISGADRAALESAGAESPSFVPENAYVAWLDPAAAAGAADPPTPPPLPPARRGRKSPAPPPG